MFSFLDYTELNQKVVHELIPSAREFVWLATANLKDMHVHRGKLSRYRSFLALLDELAERGVAIRLLHAAEPSQSFHDSIQKYRHLQGDAIELALCPRVHMKAVIVDGKKAYIGSANISGAGLGEKSHHRRNFETGILTDEPITIDRLMYLFDTIWMGKYCRECGRRDHCIAPLDMPYTS
jgi:phosphatidylserine/phosphatidylglycerophosphate/cardiolipin synthase-like enzyme